jgi:hypothetical protein
MNISEYMLQFVFIEIYTTVFLLQTFIINFILLLLNHKCHYFFDLQNKLTSLHLSSKKDASIKKTILCGLMKKNCDLFKKKRKKIA